MIHPMFHLQEVASNIPSVYKRIMKKEEVDAVYNLCRTNFLYSMSRNEMSHTQEKLPGSFVVMESPTGELLGFSFRYFLSDKHRISGFAVKPDVEYSLLIQAALLTQHCSHLNRKIETIVPAEMCEHLISQHYIWRYNIHLYSADISNLRLLQINGEGFEITETVGSYGLPFHLHVVLLNGNEKKIFFNGRPEVPEVSFKVLAQNDTVIGFGALRKHPEREWLIAPLLSSNENVIKILLNEMILYIRRREYSASIIMYVLGCSADMSIWLENCNFEKCQRKWSRYSLQESGDYISPEVTYNDAKCFVFALGSILSFRY